MNQSAARMLAWISLSVACGGSQPTTAEPVPEPIPETLPEVVSVVRPAVAKVSSSDCPDGMVRIKGSGAVGMRGDPYGVGQTRHMAQVDAPERLCEGAVAAKLGATACWVQTDLVDPILRVRTIEGPDFCIERAPFPGAGVAYPVDGMTAGTVALLDEMLKSGRFGSRRLCTASEYQLAVAGPTENYRFVYGDMADDKRCKAGQLIGSDASCANPETGVLEYGAIHSHWVRADAAFVARACDMPPCKGAGNRPVEVGSYVVLGGTNRVQTRQAPLTPHTWHDHGEPADVGCGDEGWDDQVVICAEPDLAYAKPDLPRKLRDGEAAWSRVVDSVRAHGRVTDGLAQGLGRPVCPVESTR